MSKSYIDDVVSLGLSFIESHRREWPRFRSFQDRLPGRGLIQELFRRRTLTQGSNVLFARWQVVRCRDIFEMRTPKSLTKPFPQNLGLHGTSTSFMPPMPHSRSKDQIRKIKPFISKVVGDNVEEQEWKISWRAEAQLKGVFMPLPGRLVESPERWAKRR